MAEKKNITSYNDQFNGQSKDEFNMTEHFFTKRTPKASSPYKNANRNTLDVPRSLLNLKTQSNTSTMQNTPLQSMVQIYDYFDKVKEENAANISEIEEAEAYYGQFDDPFIFTVSYHSEPKTRVRI